MLGIKIPEEIIKLIAAREQLLTNKLEKILSQISLGNNQGVHENESKL